MSIQASLQMTSVYLKGGLLVLAWLGFQVGLWAQCSVGDIGGTVFRDVPAANATSANTYATLDANESGIPNIAISIYEATGNVQYDTTDAAGNWSVTPQGFPVRVEYNWPDSWLEISPGDVNNSDIQFFTSSTCAARLGMYYPDEYCEMVPDVMTNLYVNGDPIAGGSAGAVDAIVSFPYDRLGNSIPPNPDGANWQVGAVWGAAYHRQSELAFVAAAMKRHVGLGPIGIGGIYRVDYSGASPSATSFIGLNFLGVDVGTEPARVLNADFDDPATDAFMFDAPGKIGLGGMDISADGNTLFVINLFSRKVVTIDLTNYFITGSLPGAAQIDSLPPLPNLSCSNGEARPFAVRYRRGKLYVGVVCTGENGGSTSDLTAAVCQYDLSTGLWSDAVNPFSLNYTRGGVVNTNCTTWQPWIGTYDDVTVVCRPSPMMTDIEFVDDNTLLLAFSDRYGFQKYSLQRNPSDTGTETVVNGGDLLYAYFNGTNYSVETGGTIPGGGGCGANGEGPGGGEYFCGEFFGAEHSETGMGALAAIPGSGNVLLSTMNPVQDSSGGVRRYNLQTGASGIPMGYELYETPPGVLPAGNGYAMEGQGMGGLTLLSAAPPLELTGYIWQDANGDGVQGPGEGGIADVEVSLFDINGNLQWKDTTDANGLYQFSDTLTPATTYYVAMGTDGGFDLADSTLNGSLLLTMANTGTGADPDKNDSDIVLASGINPNFNGYPYYSFMTAYAGSIVHHFDAGFAPMVIPPDLVTTDTTICAGNSVNLSDLVNDVNNTSGTSGYYTTLNDAINQTNLIPSLVTPVDSSEYYVRKDSGPGEFDIDSMWVHVHPNPELLTNDIDICSGVSTNLLLGATDISGLSVNLVFYNSLSDALAEINPLGSPVVSPSDTTEYYVRSTTIATPFCYDIDSLTVNVSTCSFDLALQLVLGTGQASTVNPKDTVIYTLRVFNQGTMPAYDVAVMMLYSAGADFDNTLPVNAGWTPMGPALLDTIPGPLMPGDTALLDIALIVQPFYSGASITNLAEIIGYDNDQINGNPQPTDEDSVTDTNGFNDPFIDNEINDNPDHPEDDDDHDLEIVFINQIFDLAYRVITPPGSPFDICDTVTYSMRIYNQGNSPAFDIEVTNYLAAGMNFDPTLPNNNFWQLVGGQPTIVIPGPLAPGDSITFRLDLRVDCNFMGTTISQFFEITDYDNDTNDLNTPPVDEDSDTDLNPSNDLVIDNEIEDNPDNPNDDDDHDGAIIAVNEVVLTIDTLYFTTMEASTLTGLCMDLSELTDVVDTTMSCGDPLNGMVTMTPPSECVDYTPANGFSGQDTACVVVCDINTFCDTTILVFTVIPLPEMDTVWYNTLENESLANLCMDLTELTGAVDQVYSCGDPQNGSLVISSPDECVDYIPNTGFSGQDTACVAVCDVNAVCDTTILVFSVMPLPQLDTMWYTTFEEVPLLNLCMDLSELPGPVGLVTSCGNPQNGILTITPGDECVDYTPSNGYVGPDTACVMICDINFVCDTTVLVFDILLVTATDTTYHSTPENTTLSNICMDLSELTGAVDDVTSCGDPQNGTLTINSPSECVDYIPNNGYTGQDTACVSVCDVNGICDTTILVFTITSLPSTTTDTTYHNVVENTTLPNICMDLSELTGAVDDVTSCGDPQNGTLTINSPSECVDYIPNNGYTGQDTACVSVCDVNGICDTTILVFTITSLPTTTTDTTYHNVVENTTLPNICMDLSELTGAVDDVTSCGDPQNGTLTINSPSECVDYIPNNGYTGQDTACVSVCDVNGICDTTILVFTITSLPSTTTDTTYHNVVENTTLPNICMDLSELTGAVDDVTSCGDPQNGTLTINSPSECVDYIPNNDYTGQDTACVSVCDVNGICDTTILVFTITSLPSTTTDTTYHNVVENTTLPNICMDLSELTAGVDTIYSCGDPQNGTLTINTPSECVDYLPNNGYTGQDTACVSVCDVNGICDTTILVFTITPLPSTTTDTTYHNVVENTPLPNICMDLSELTAGVDTIYSCGDPQNGTLTINTPSECVDYLPNNGYTGQDTACVVVCDLSGMCDTTVLVFTVVPDCTDFISATSLMATLADCSADTALCIEVPYDEIGNYQIYDNGSIYGGAMEGCDNDTTFVYDYSGLPGAGFAGPYSVDIWVVDGVAFMDTIVDMADLEDSMNVWNPTGNWILDMANSVISGGVTTSNYSNINLTQLSSGMAGSLLVAIDVTSNGTALDFGFGGHQVVFEEVATGCRDTVLVDVDCMGCPDIFVDTTHMTAVGCDSLTLFCTPILSTDIVDYTIVDNGLPYSGAFDICNANTAIPLDTGFHVLIFTDTVNVCVDTAFVNIICTDCPDIIVDELLDAPNCNSTVDYCIPIHPDNIGGYTLYDNGVLYGGSLSGCEFDSLVSFLTIGFNVPGSYMLEEWIVGGNNFGGATFGTLQELVDSMNVWHPSGNWMLDGLLIIGEGQVSAFGPMVVSSGGTEVASSSPTLQLLPQQVAIPLDTGQHVIVVLDNATGCADTALVTVDCVPVVDPHCDFIDFDDQTFILNDCNDAADICLNIPLDSLADFAIYDNGTLFTGGTTGCQSNSFATYDYSTLTGNGNFGPYTVDEWMVGNQVFSGQFENIDDLVDSMNVWDPASGWVHDVGNGLIRATINSGQSFGSLIIIHLATGITTTLGVEFVTVFTRVAISVTTGIHEIVVENLVSGCADTALVEVNCISPDTWTQTIEVNTTDTLCFDIGELPGTATSLVNFCESQSGEYVLFEGISGGWCISATGIEAGVDSACIAICDDLGYCDTTWVIVTVIDNSMLPDANQDSFYTVVNTMITDNLTVNDDLGGGDGIVHIVQLPLHGQIVVDTLSGLIVYTPSLGYCNDSIPDMMRYAICNDYGCDTTEVFFFVSCVVQELSFVSGFSPNGDDINDAFIIQGLTNYPNHNLSLFNRWGNRVYYTENYQNDWRGTFGEVDLPDGTYFYVFDEGDGTLHTGYVVLHR